MKRTETDGHPTYTPDDDGVLTVGKLIEILSAADPEDYIIIGRGLHYDDELDYVERVIIGKHSVLLATEIAEPDGTASV